MVGLGCLYNANMNAKRKRVKCRGSARLEQGRIQSESLQVQIFQRAHIIFNFFELAILKKKIKHADLSLCVISFYKRRALCVCSFFKIIISLNLDYLFNQLQYYILKSILNIICIYFLRFSLTLKIFFVH